VSIFIWHSDFSLPHYCLSFIIVVVIILIIIILVVVVQFQQPVHIVMFLFLAVLMSVF